MANTLFNVVKELYQTAKLINRFELNTELLKFIPFKAYKITLSETETCYLSEYEKDSYYGIQFLDTSNHSNYIKIVVSKYGVEIEPHELSKEINEKTVKDYIYRVQNCFKPYIPIIRQKEKELAHLIKHREEVERKLLLMDFQKRNWLDWLKEKILDK